MRTTKWIAAAGIFFSLAAQAEGLDYGAGAGLRTLPFGGSVYAEAGYGLLLWGVTLPGYYKYGYLRPGARVSASGVTYRADLFLDLFPISFFGFRVGYLGSARLVDSASSIDCDHVACDGTLGATYLKAQGAFGYGPAFAALSARYADYMPSSASAEPFLDEVAVLVGKPGGDHQLSYEAVLGYNWQDKQIGFYASSDRFLGTGNSNDLESVYGRLRSGSFAYTLGVGMYASSTQARSPTVYALVHWTGLQVMGLQ